MTGLHGLPGAQATCHPDTSHTHRTQHRLGLTRPQNQTTIFLALTDPSTCLSTVYCIHRHRRQSPPKHSTFSPSRWRCIECLSEGQTTLRVEGLHNTPADHHRLSWGGTLTRRFFLCAAHHFPHLRYAVLRNGFLLSCLADPKLIGSSYFPCLSPKVHVTYIQLFLHLF